MTKLNYLDVTNELNEQLVAVRFVTNNITRESMPMFLKNISTLFINKLESFLGIFSTNTDRLDADKVYKDYNTFVKDMYERKSDVNKISKELQYPEVSNLVVPTVVGLNPKKNLLDLTNNVVSAMPLVKDNIINELVNLDTYLANILTDPNFRTQSAPQKQNMSLVKLESDLYKKLDEVIVTKAIEDTAKLHTLIPNFSSLNTVIESLYGQARGITLEFMKDIEKAIDLLHDKVKVLEEDMRKPNFEIHKNVLKKLTDDLEMGAKTITVSISYIHLFNQTVLITTNIIKMLKDKC